jgi:hypothetical protein
MEIVLNLSIWVNKYKYNFKEKCMTPYKTNRRKDESNIVFHTEIVKNITIIRSGWNTNIRQSMLKLKADSDFHELFLNYYHVY